MTDLKLFIFNSVYEWSNDNAAVVVARTTEEAVKLYQEVGFEGVEGRDFTVESRMIENGLVIEANGFDSATVTVVREGDECLD